MKQEEEELNENEINDEDKNEAIKVIEDIEKNEQIKEKKEKDKLNENMEEENEENEDVSMDKEENEIDEEKELKEKDNIVNKKPEDLFPKEDNNTDFDKNLIINTELKLSEKEINDQAISLFNTYLESDNNNNKNLSEKNIPNPQSPIPILKN